MVHDIRPEEKHELPSIIDVRETQQYGVALSLEEKRLQHPTGDGDENTGRNF